MEDETAFPQRRTTKVTTAKVTNKDLPPQLTVNDVWTKKIVPTMIRWFAAQTSPWVPSDVPSFETALELISRHFAGDDYELSNGTSSPEFTLVRSSSICNMYAIANTHVGSSTTK